MPDKAGDQAGEIVFQEKANESQKPEEENGGECEPDEIGPARRPQAGNAAT